MRKKQNNRIGIITEGTRREPQYFQYLWKQFKRPPQTEIIYLPADQNIYMIWKQLRTDNLQTDIIEIIRECCKESEKQLDGFRRDDFQELYLFFDFDPHHTEPGLEISDVLQGMAETFCNETDMGKLYISYPMIEALRDISEWSCKPYHCCSVPYKEISEYKHFSGEGNKYASVQKYDKYIWSMIIEIFLIRCKCLFAHEIETDSLLSWYKSEIVPSVILKKQLEFFHANRAVFVLSAFPEFLLDYFKLDCLEKMTYNLHKITRPVDCGKNDEKHKKNV